jgi:hypothetical protein
MYLRQIEIEASKAVGGDRVLELLPKLTARWLKPDKPVFRWTLHHAKEVFLALLPPKFVLDGSRKITIVCGWRSGREEQYSQMNGTSVYFVEDFEFDWYRRITPPNREDVILQLLENSFLNIGSRCHWSRRQNDALYEIVKATRQCDFAQKLSRRRLSKWTTCRRLRVNIVRHLNRNDGEAWSCEVSRDDGVLVHSEWLHERPSHFARSELYNRSEWDGNSFKVRSRYTDRIEFQLDVTPFLEQASG